MKFTAPGDTFAREALTQIFQPGKTVIDIGGGLRIDPSRNNRKLENEWLLPYVKEVNYKVLDKVADYNPDIVGDIHDLPLPDNSVDAITCLSVLEHVEEPQTAVKEMYRVIKPGGYCFIYVPFLFYYHPMEGYYKDFYRFTPDGLKYMARDFNEVTVHNAYGALATVMNLFPLFSRRVKPFHLLDRWIGKDTSNQSSGFHALCKK